MVRITVSASAAKRAAVYTSVGSAMSIRWCGMPRRSSIGTLSVPMSKPRYTAVESQLTISPPNRPASDSPRALLPHAVGPSTATTSGRSAGATSAEHVDEDVYDQRRKHDQEPELLDPRW